MKPLYREYNGSDRETRILYHRGAETPSWVAIDPGVTSTRSVPVLPTGTLPGELTEPGTSALVQVGHTNTAEEVPGT